MLNKESIDLIKSFEGLGLKAYKDAVGVWTIGYGHTNSAGLPKVIPGQMITEVEAEEILTNDLKKYEASVQKLVKVKLTDNQYGALVSFVYNLGEGNFEKSTLLKKINSGDLIGASNEFGKWNKAGGKVLKGLTRRREAERKLFLKPAFIDTQKPVQPLPDDPGISVPENPKPSVKPNMSVLEIIRSVLNLIFGRK